MLLSMAAPGFLRGGINPIVGGATYYLAKICQKLHENEKIGPGRPKCYYVDATDYIVLILLACKSVVF